jgi:tetratricopeptide (TPR) repeat protein
MAESAGVSGILGTDSESPAEVSTPEAPSGLDPTAAAMAADAAKNDPKLAEEVSEYFRKQGRLVEIQTEHLHEQRTVNLSLLKLKRFAERLNVGLRVFFVLVATVLGVAGAILIHDAITSRSVIIEPFETPRALADRGFTGTVAASSLLDDLRRLQAATRSSVQRRDLSNAWSNEIKLTVPETGISIAEISQLLRARFGHDIRVNGDIVQTLQGDIEVTVRGDEILPATFRGAGGDLRKATSEASEYVYSQSQPALWAAYLVGSGRNQEAIEFCRAAINSSPKLDRPSLLTYWAVAISKSQGADAEAAALVQRAIALQPDYWYAYDILSNIKVVLGDEEGTWRVGEDLRKAAGGRPGRAPEVSYDTVDGLTWNLPGMLAGWVADAEVTSGNGSLSYSLGPLFALIQALNHDPAAADLALRTTKLDTADPTIVPTTHLVRGILARQQGNISLAVDELEEFLTSYSNPAVAWAAFGFNCWVAPAEEAARHPDKADAVLNEGGTFVDCYRFHGDILDGRGDWKGAQQWYAKSVALAPDLPAGYYSWGLALAEHGDLGGAAIKLKEANRRGPHWADPLKAWGDVLARQGKTQDAVAKYDEALRYAPYWQQLKEARASVAGQRT